ncbi:MAG: PTS ascorbate transporter subunit IIC [Firmicutes bacterium]|nr:PTS ascorbate transporter subunit IIC [Bacillota bacterium]
MAKKQVPLRLSPKLYEEIAAWAEDDFRSVNGQIEFLLTECVRQRKKTGKYGPGPSVKDDNPGSRDD